MKVSGEFNLLDTKNREWHEWSKLSKWSELCQWSELDELSELVEWSEFIKVSWVSEVR